MSQASESPLHQAVLCAWQDALKATHNESLKQQLAQSDGELLPRFAAHYQAIISLRRRMRRSLQRQWKRSLAGIALLMALGQTPALSATITVGGTCTLAHAIVAANTNTTAGGRCALGGGPDQIVLPKKTTFQLRTPNIASDYDPTGLPTIDSAVTIVGNGSTIKREATAPEFRIFAVAPTGRLTLQNTTVSGGAAVDRVGSYLYSQGGAINSFKGSVTLINSKIVGNRTSYYGGGVYMYGGALALTNSTISGNSAVRDGGGVYMKNGATATLTRSTVSGNSATRSGYGGGIFAGGESRLTLTRSTVSGNSATGLGGGVFVGYNGTAALNSSTVSGNSAAANGGGLFAGRNSSVRLSNSNISFNAAAYGGGAYLNDRSAVTVKNTTIIGNSATAQGGGMYVDLRATPTVSDTTITGNRATREGGGVYVSRYGTLNLTRTLISGNTGSKGREVYANRGSIASSGNQLLFANVNAGNFNIFGHRRSSGINFAPQITDIVPTQSVAQIVNPQTGELVSGSPAIDAINNGTCPLNDRDQRGALRNVGGTCDVGAIEFGGTPTRPPPPPPSVSAAPPLPSKAALPAPPEAPLSSPGEPPAQAP